MENLLSILIFLPFVSGVVAFLVKDDAARKVALGGSLLTMVVSFQLWSGYNPTGDVFQFTETRAWIPDYGVSYSLGVDGISVLMILLTTVLMPLVILSATPAVEKKVNHYLGWMLILQAAMIGTFAALDTFLFYVFWELMLIPMYFLIGIWGGKNRLYATVKFFIYTMVGSLLMLVALIVLYRMQTEQGVASAAVEDLYMLDIPHNTQMWMFAAFGLAFAIKVPMFPFHTWLPDAHVQAPTGGSVILAGVLLKMGAYGFIRFAMPLFPEAALSFTPLILVLAVIGIIYGALVAMAQDDIKKLVAYSSVSHLGFVMLGLFALNSTGMTGAIYQMVNHGISTGALFLLVGMLYERRHTRMISEYGGLSKVVPVFAFVFMIVTFSSIGLPGMNGFVGEFLVLIGSFQYSPWLTAGAATGVILGAVYMLWMFQRVMFGPNENPANANLPDLTRRELIVMAPLLVLIVLLGVYPGPFLAILEPSVDRLVLVMEGVPMIEAVETVAQVVGGHQ